MTKSKASKTTRPRPSCSTLSIPRYVSASFSMSVSILVLQQSPNARTNAFSPMTDSTASSLNKNKKCQGSACNSRSSSLPSSGMVRGSNSNNPNSESGTNNNGAFGHNGNTAMPSSSDSFALRMASFQIEEEMRHHDDDDDDDMNMDMDMDNNINNDAPTAVLERRKFIHNLLTTSAGTVAVATAAATTSTILLPPEPAAAYQKAYPDNLDFVNNDSSINLQSIRQERIAVTKSKTQQSKTDIITQPLVFKNTSDLLASGVWASALWFLSGSRNNALVKPLANVLYGEEEQWVKDRNEGLFAPLPPVFLLVLGVVFLMLGVVTDRALLLLAEGESTVVLQLAGVSLIGGASLELGRIASGEKMITRDDLVREEMLASEFEEFAAKKLIFGQGGSVHRSEVIKAFRRYFAKYRVENDQYPLNDLEIERLLKTWNRREGNMEGVSSAGFVKGVKINDQAQIRM